jgi:tetratricopeptide (TPR) repeat protein
MIVITGGLGHDIERHLLPLACLFSPSDGAAGSRVALETALEACMTSSTLAPAFSKLFDLREDYGRFDPLDVVLAHRAAGRLEAQLLADRIAQHLAIANGLERDPRHGRLVPTEPANRELLARTLARRANAHRIRGEFNQATRFLPLVDELLDGVEGKTLAEIRFLTGLLQSDTEQWCAAARSFAVSIAEYRRLGKSYQALRTEIAEVMLKRARGVQPRTYLRRAEELLAAFENNTPFVVRNPAFLDSFRLNVLLYRVEAGKIEAAADAWTKISRFSQRSTEARRVGLGGIIHTRLGSLNEALAMYRFAIGEFEALGMAADVGCFRLHLAELLLLMGRRQKCEGAVRDALDVFRKCRLPRSVMNALDRLQETLRTKNGLREAIKDAILRASGIAPKNGKIE